MRSNRFDWLLKYKSIPLEVQYKELFQNGIKLKNGFSLEHITTTEKKEYLKKPYLLLLKDMGSELHFSSSSLVFQAMIFFVWIVSVLQIMGIIFPSYND